MSNALAVAAVTSTLQALIEQGVRSGPGLGDTTVTFQAPDRARDSANTANQINLYLYQMLPNAAWRNQDLPRQLMPGETGMPPLALELYYLMTAYGRNNDTSQPFSQQLMARAMNVLHDHAVLAPAEIRAAVAAALPESDLDRQVERVRVTLQPMSVEDISKLWTAFQTQYRLSVAYQVTVVLIESTLPPKMPLPVLTRGPGDSGAAALGDLLPPFPTLQAAAAPGLQAAARLGDTVTLTGHHLGGTSIGIAFQHQSWDSPLEIAPAAGASDDALSVVIPILPAAWPAGLYSVHLRVRRPNETQRRTSNGIGLAVAPSITIAPLSAAAGDITWTVGCNPEVLPQQRVVLLLGQREIAAEPFASQTGTLTFVATDVAAGQYWVRLRVDGVDSLLVDRSATPPVFDASQKVTVT